VKQTWEYRAMTFQGTEAESKAPQMNQLGADGWELVAFRRDLVSELRKQGLSWRKIAQRLGTSATSARRATQGPDK